MRNTVKSKEVMDEANRQSGSRDPRWLSHREFQTKPKSDKHQQLCLLSAFQPPLPSALSQSTSPAISVPPTMARLNDYAAPAESVDACELMRPVTKKKRKGEEIRGE